MNQRQGCDQKEAIARKYNTNQQILEILKYLKANGAVENSVLNRRFDVEFHPRILELEEKFFSPKVNMKNRGVESIQKFLGMSFKYNTKRF